MRTNKQPDSTAEYIYDFNMAFREKIYEVRNVTPGIIVHDVQLND